jgi:hypothetical protein
MNRFKRYKKILTTQESLIFWTLNKGKLTDPLDKVDKQELDLLINKNKSEILNEFSRDQEKKSIKDLIDYAAELEAANFYLQVELAKADVAEGVEDIYQGKAGNEQSYNAQNSFLKMFKNTGNRFIEMIERSISKNQYYLTSKGGKKRGLASQPVKDDIRSEFLKVKDSFKDYSYTSRFCIRMEKKHSDKLSKTSIDRYVADLKKELM